MRHLLTFVLALVTAACGANPDTPARLAMNDVSILFPLPSPDQLDLLLAPASVGAHGEILPAATYATVPTLVVNQTSEDTFNRLRVVGARVDPCFPGPPAPCRRQLRLVLQPLGPSFEGDIAADDAAIHLLYELTGDELATLTDELRALQAASPAATTGALRVHPGLEAGGLASAFADELRATLLRHVGAERLSRLTFMQLQNFNRNGWVFGGFDVAGGTPTPIVIVDAAAERQKFLNVIVESDQDFLGSVDPAGLGADDVSLLFNSENTRSAPPAEVLAAVGAALRLENPDVHTPESASCVACHLATPTRLWVERNLGHDTTDHPDRFRSSQDLRLMNDATALPAVLRAFGYVHRSVIMSQRTVNETAVVALRLNSGG